MPELAPYITRNRPTSDQADIKEVENYSEILGKYHLKYREIGYHLHVGETKKTQGWIIHISIVRWQITSLLEKIIPDLISSHVFFKIVKDKETARSILDGKLGDSQIGKVISLYPESDEAAITIAKRLIELTPKFKGPVIPTDAYLGSNVYTRFGAFNPVIITNSEGKQEKYIYNSNNELVPDTHSIPFIMPEGTTWPFHEISSVAIPAAPIERGPLLGKFKQICTLKRDAKGSVYKGVYLKNGFIPKACIIKQGKKNMWSDENDRDMIDRLIWQKEICEKLNSVIAAPKIIDFFICNDDAYLIMQYIKGPNLVEKVCELNNNCKAWVDLSKNHRKIITEYLLKSIDIMSVLQIQNVVHRDFTPVNFLVDNKNRLFLIDNELMYDLVERKPYPPFEAGTHGFMSPQQAAMQYPSLYDDIYSLGAFLLGVFTGISPIQVDCDDQKMLTQIVYIITGSKELCAILPKCFLHQSDERPSINELKDCFLKYYARIGSSILIQKSIEAVVNTEKLKDVIIRSIHGLISPPTVIFNGLWYSKSSTSDSYGIKGTHEFSKSCGLFEGITGVLYFLAKAHRFGFPIHECKQAMAKGWSFLTTKYLNSSSDLTPGLYGGAAGIALALSESIDAGILEDTELNRKYIYDCLIQETHSLDICQGIAGKGVVLLKCKQYLNEETFEKLLSNFLEQIFYKISKKGYWISVQEENGKKYNAISFSYGNTGIVYFLLLAYQRNPIDTLRNNLYGILNIMLHEANKMKKKYKKEGCRILLNGDSGIVDGLQGLIIMVAKAYEIFKDESFKAIAEDLLYLYPSKIVHGKFDQFTGLPGIGEVYLYCYRIFRNEEWLRRATWIAQFLSSCCKLGDNGSLYWLGNNSEFPTADFMTGNSGIIHFLINLHQNGKLGYRLIE